VLSGGGAVGVASSGDAALAGRIQAEARGTSAAKMSRMSVRDVGACMHMDRGKPVRAGC
jgi:hypothetical protein